MPIVTLSTDFKENDFVAGAMKGQLLSLNKELIITDISHELSSGNYAHTSYVCRNAFKYYPENTIHIVLIDLFKNNTPHLLLTEYKQQYIIAPDNGILTMIFNQSIENIVKVNLNAQERTTIAITNTAANIANELSKGKYIRQIGKPVEEIEEIYPMRPAIGPNWIEGQIIFIDKYGNAVVNITRKEFEEYGKGRRFQILFSRNDIVKKISPNYADVQTGSALAWFNSAGNLELAISNGQIAHLFGLRDISVAQARHNKLYETVRIFFEEEPVETPPL